MWINFFPVVARKGGDGGEKLQLYLISWGHVALSYVFHSG